MNRYKQTKEDKKEEKHFDGITSKQKRKETSKLETGINDGN